MYIHMDMCMFNTCVCIYIHMYVEQMLPRVTSATIPLARGGPASSSQVSFFCTGI